MTDHEIAPPSPGNSVERRRLGELAELSGEQLLDAFIVLIDAINDVSSASRDALAEAITEIEAWTMVPDRSGKKYALASAWNADGSATLFQIALTSDGRDDVGEELSAISSLESAEYAGVTHFSADAVIAMGLSAEDQYRGTLHRLLRASNPKFENDMPHFGRQSSDTFDEERSDDELLDLWHEHVTSFSVALKGQQPLALSTERALDSIIHSSAEAHADREIVPLSDTNTLRNRIMYDETISESERGWMIQRLRYLLMNHEGSLQVAANVWFDLVDRTKRERIINDDVVRDHAQHLVETTGLNTDRILSVADAVTKTLTPSQDTRKLME